MIRIITCTDSKAKNAGPKAKEDIIHILKKKYGDNLIVKTIYEDNNINIIKKIIYFIKKLFFIIINILNNDKLIIQYPMSKQFEFLSLFPKKRTIVVIHDLQGLRLLNNKKEKREIRKLKKFFHIIAHNNSMKDYLTERGIKTERIYLINIFDYLVSNSSKRSNIKIEDGVAFVGNLSEKKSPFIHQLEENKINFNLCLYGVGVDHDINSKIKYIGSYNPDILPLEIKQKFGLVWDGNLDESDENRSYKNYTKYNNPHKLSCYLAAGIPVIVWEKAAISKFIKKYDLGYTINSIYDINNLDTKDYTIKKDNVKFISEKIKSGYFTNQVFDKIII